MHSTWKSAMAYKFPEGVIIIVEPRQSSFSLGHLILERTGVESPYRMRHLSGNHVGLYMYFPSAMSGITFFFKCIPSILPLNTNDCQYSFVFVEYSTVIKLFSISGTLNTKICTVS